MDLQEADHCSQQVQHFVQQGLLPQQPYHAPFLQVPTTGVVVAQPPYPHIHSIKRRNVNDAGTSGNQHHPRLTKLPVKEHILLVDLVFVVTKRLYQLPCVVQNDHPGHVVGVVV